MCPPFAANYEVTTDKGFETLEWERNCGKSSFLGKKATIVSTASFIYDSLSRQAERPGFTDYGKLFYEHGTN